MPPTDPRLLEAFIRQLDETLQILLLVTGALQDGRTHYAYVSMPLSRYPAFRQAEAEGNYNLADFGEIIMHGDGEIPPESVRKQMEERYSKTHMLEAQFQTMLNGFKLRSAGEAHE